MREISGILKSTRVALEAQAYKTFGAAVQKATDRVLGGIFGKNSPSSKPPPNSAQAAVAEAAQREPGVWDSPRYAAQKTSRAIGGTFENSAKTKFLFKVSFSFHPEMIEKAAEYAQVSIDELTRELDYAIKQIDMPKVEFEYEEVNMYNFRTKVLRQIKHGDISMTLYDDIGNKALNLINAYRMLHMPISRREQSPSAPLHDYGFEFDSSAESISTSMRAGLPQNRNSVLAKITIHQYYMDLTSKEPVKVNDFVFVNPRFNRIDINDQDHEAGGDFNAITIVFDYDALFMETGQSAAPDKHKRLPTSVMKHDILNNFDEGNAEIYRGQQVSPGKERNPFVDILARQGQRLVQTATSGAIRRAIGNNPAGRALSGAIGSLSGALGEATNRAVNSVATGFSQGMALPTFPKLRDNTTPASQAATLTKQTSSNDLGDWAN